ncbi:MAG: hypothetical protein HUJ27_06495 [Rhodobacteraceae bacterium]|nr:hypothetical protein [Paracoccaceae bacterium]
MRQQQGRADELDIRIKHGLKGEVAISDRLYQALGGYGVQLHFGRCWAAEVQAG